MTTTLRIAQLNVSSWMGVVLCIPERVGGGGGGEGGEVCEMELGVLKMWVWLSSALVFFLHFFFVTFFLYVGGSHIEE